MEDSTIKYKVMPTLVWLILLMFAGAKLVSLAIEGAFGVSIAQLVITRFMDPVTLIIVLVLYFAFFFLAYLTTSRTAVSFVFASLFAIVCGAGIFGTVFYVADIVGAEIVPEALLLTTAVFAIAMVWEWVTKKDLRNWGFWLLLFLIIAIILTVVEIFVPSTLLRVLVDLGVVLLFAIMVAYDTYWARQHAPDDRWMMAALKFFIDFINILIRIILILIEIRQRK